MRVLTVAVLVACSGPQPRPPKGEVAVSFEGRVENGPFRFGKDDLARLPRHGFKAVSPFTGKEAKFEGLAVTAILARIPAAAVDPAASRLVLCSPAAGRAPKPQGQSKVSANIYSGPKMADERG